MTGDKLALLEPETSCGIAVYASVFLEYSPGILAWNIYLKHLAALSPFAQVLACGLIQPKRAHANISQQFSLPCVPFRLNRRLSESHTPVSEAALIRADKRRRARERASKSALIEQIEK